MRWYVDWYDDEMPQCLLDSYSLYSSHLNVHGQDASHHEHLEATFRLREWVQDKASPEEIALLFAAV